MKQFFYIFLFFLTVLSPFSTGTAADLPSVTLNTLEPESDIEVIAQKNNEFIEQEQQRSQSNDDFIIRKLSGFQQSVKSKIKKANELDPKDISIVDKPENMNVYTLLSLMGKDAGLFTGDKGLGQRQEFPFGTARLVSCQGNLDGKTSLITALSVVLKPDWVLKKPNILSSQSDLWQSEKILYPLRLENHGKRTDSYTEMVSFPIIYQLTDTDKDFSVEKEITLTACYEDVCRPYTAVYSLTVQTGKGYQTDVCPSIMHDLYKTTSPFPADAQAKAHRDESGLIQLDLTFAKPVSAVNVQIDNPFSFTIQKMFVTDKRVNIILKPDEPINPTEEIQFKILTSAGWYDLNIVPDNEPFTFDTPYFQLSNARWYGFYFLFFSPFYLLFWSMRPKNRAELSQTFYFVLVNMALFVIIWGCFLYFAVPVYRFFDLPIVLIAQCLLISYLLIKPFITQKQVLFLMLFLPYPFLYNITAKYTGGKFFDSFGTTFWWGFCAMLPFALTRAQPIIFQSLANAPKPVRKIIRLPLLILFVWTLFNAVLSLTQTENTYTEKALTQALAENKTVFLSVYRTPCPTCALNQYAGKHFQPTNAYVENNLMVFMQLNQNTPEGQAFLNKYNTPEGQSFNILYGPKQKYGVRIENKYIQPEDWIDYIGSVGGLPEPEKIFIDELNQEPVEIDYEKIESEIRRVYQIE